MIEMASKCRITKVSRVFPWIYAYTPGVKRGLPCACMWHLRAPGTCGHDNFRIEIRTNFDFNNGIRGAGSTMPRTESGGGHSYFNHAAGPYVLRGWPGLSSH